jgi:hypothetical protein
MVFDISRLDKIQLLQTLYLHAAPRGKGHLAFRTAKIAGKIVEGWLSDADCKMIIQGSYQTSGYLVDYFYGTPLKQYWHTETNGQITVDTLPYDAAHGKYRFLEAVLSMFEPEDIFIIEKKYDQRGDIYLTPEKVGERPIEASFQLLLENAKLNTNNFGLCWTIDHDNPTYQELYRLDLGQ